jgi:DNA-binding MarR family transcriptional regulator
MEYEYLKLHTQDEFDSMPEDIYYDYEESITELADDLGIDSSVIKKTEEKLVNIAELLKKRSIS